MPAADWPAALADIDAAVRAALADLDGYETRWQEVPAGGGRQPPDGSSHQGADAPRPPETTDPWDDRLAAVAELAEQIDGDLAGRADALAAWRESLQRSLGSVAGNSVPSP